MREYVVFYLKGNVAEMDNLLYGSEKEARKAAQIGANALGRRHFVGKIVDAVEPEMDAASGTDW